MKVGNYSSLALHAWEPQQQQKKKSAPLFFLRPPCPLFPPFCVLLGFFVDFVCVCVCVHFLSVFKKYTGDLERIACDVGGRECACARVSGECVCVCICKCEVHLYLAFRG